MIEEITIRGLGIIEEATLQLGSGLTVLTGETGAGKTMVTTALGLLLGGRADAGLVRAQSERLLVEGRVRVCARSPVVARVIEAGGELDDVLILGRTVSSEGRSRAQVGGRSVPVGLLAELGEQLVARHGQHDQQHLRSPTQQRALLDRYGGESVAAPLTAYRDTHRALLEVRAALGDLVGRARARIQEADLLRLGLAEIAAVDPQSGEEVTLAAEISRLAHADALRGAASSAHRLLHAEPDDRHGADAATALDQARRAVEAAARHDPELTELGRRLTELGFLLADVSADLASYAARVDVDPARLAAAADRQAALARLLRKYGDSADEVRSWAATSAERLDELDADSDVTSVLRARQSELSAELTANAEQLSAARRRAAMRLQAAIGTELVGLAMPNARMEVSVRRVESATEVAPDGAAAGSQPLPTFGRDGVDEIEFLLASHLDAPLRPIQRVASGGELSRIMLAVQVVLADLDSVGTFIFDEVDAGIGGKAAVEVGRRLARLADTAQVLVVTHLPQVAAFADHHLSVSRADGVGAPTVITRLDGEDRVRELSRMLAGRSDSAPARAHAEELLAAAGQEQHALGKHSRPADGDPASGIARSGAVGDCADEVVTRWS